MLEPSVDVTLTGEEYESGYEKSCAVAMSYGNKIFTN